MGFHRISWDFIGFHVNFKGIQMISSGFYEISRYIMWISWDFIEVYVVGYNDKEWDMSCLLGEGTPIRHGLLENPLFSLDDFAIEMKNLRGFPLPWAGIDCQKVRIYLLEG